MNEPTELARAQQALDEANATVEQAEQALQQAITLHEQMQAVGANPNAHVDLTMLQNYRRVMQQMLERIHLPAPLVVAGSETMLPSTNLFERLRLWFRGDRSDDDLLRERHELAVICQDMIATIDQIDQQVTQMVQTYETNQQQEQHVAASLVTLRQQQLDIARQQQAEAQSWVQAVMTAIEQCQQHVDRVKQDIVHHQQELDRADQLLAHERRDITRLLAHLQIVKMKMIALDSNFSQ
ncbi:MAG: hypothetical protein HC837_14380 [Chloroflexaceae bacterium]|nr:hypothetical protein [Chloroflexaceae bacterium]